MRTFPLMNLLDQLIETCKLTPIAVCGRVGPGTAAVKLKFASGDSECNLLMLNRVGASCVRLRIGNARNRSETIIYRDVEAFETELAVLVHTVGAALPGRPLEVSRDR